MFVVSMGNNARPAQPNGSVQYNNGGVFGGNGDLTYNGLGSLTLSGAGAPDAVLAVGTGVPGLINLGGVGTAGSSLSSGSSSLNIQCQAGPVFFSSNGISDVGAFDNTGNFLVRTAGRGLQVAEGTGSDALQGTATLVGGTVTVANTHIASTSRIFLTSQADGGVPGFLRVSNRTNGVSFTVTSSNALDTSMFAFEIFSPPDL